MVNYPDVMQKAQAELDSVVGRERPPTFDDEDALPYIRAIVQEPRRRQEKTSRLLLGYSAVRVREEGVRGR